MKDPFDLLPWVGLAMLLAVTILADIQLHTL
jgi:hypothetical protein